MNDKIIRQDNNTENLRRHGSPSYAIAVIHGGPGVAGEMAPIARKLSQSRGIIEPFQTAQSIEGQINELKYLLEKNTDIPVTLIGFSWGAWLSFIFTSQFPEMIKKLILVSSAPFELQYAKKIMQTRLSRLNEKEKLQVTSLIEALNSSNQENRNELFSKLGKILSKADAYEPIENTEEGITYRYDIFRSIWMQAAQLRKSDELLNLAKKIHCPVIAMHGDYDPHPAEGVKKPLSKHLNNFKFILIPNCGHKPWLEKQAKELFYSNIEKELV